jgi:hypothetical protein
MHVLQIGKRFLNHSNRIGGATMKGKRLAWAIALAAFGCAGKETVDDACKGGAPCPATGAPAAAGGTTAVAPAAPAAAATTGVKPTAKETVLQVADFKITNAKVVALKGASKGKAVHINAEKDRAETMVTLAKGSYQLEVYIQSHDGDTDAVFVTVAGNEMRFFNDEYDKVGLCTPVAEDLFEIKKDGDYPVIVHFAEPNVYVDRVVLRKLK